MIREIDFETIKDFWSIHLWPGRESIIEPVSCIDSSGNIDLSIKNYIPHFFGYYKEKQLVGVISICPTSAIEMRQRGVCVLKDFRGQGIANQLIKHCFQYTKSVEYFLLWTMARIENIEFYNKFGFSEKLQVTSFEFGPHIIMDIKW